VRGVVADGLRSARASARRTLVAAASAIALAACSLTLPFEDRSSAIQSDPDVTGSITPRSARDAAPAIAQPSPFSAKLDDEDWRRQRAALATALDPQGNGAQVRWDNPDSGSKGAFAPIGDPYLIRHDVCRIFVAMVAAKGPEEWFQGSACRVIPGEWRIGEVKPWRKPS
jgi:surface antigen